MSEKESNPLVPGRGSKRMLSPSQNGRHLPPGPRPDGGSEDRAQVERSFCHSTFDLWVNGKEVVQLDLLPLLAELRGSSPNDLSGILLEAMSADILLTPDARTEPVVTREPGPDLRFTLWGAHIRV